MNKLAIILCISTALILPPTAKAWSGAGHQVIAAEAYRQLPPNLQKKVTEILKAHPDYEKWEESFTSESTCTTEKVRRERPVGLALGLLTLASIAQVSPISSGRG